MTKAKKIGDALVIDIKFKEQNKTTHFTVYGKNSIGVYSYNAIMNPDTDCSQFIAIPDGDITHITFKAMEGYKKECKILISNPHNLTGFILNDPAVSLQFDGLHFCRELKCFSIKNTDSKFKLNDLNECYNLRKIELDNTCCTGSIGDLINLPDLMWASINNCQEISGNISVLQELRKMWRFSASNSSVYGDLSTINCPDIEVVRLDDTLCTGDFNKFKKLNPDLGELRIGKHVYRRCIEG